MMLATNDLPPKLLSGREPTLAEAADDMQTAAQTLVKRLDHPMVACMLGQRDLVALRLLACDLQCWSDVARRAAGAAVARRPVPWWRRVRWAGVR